MQMKNVNLLFRNSTR